jgi:hypothetical protein
MNRRGVRMKKKVERPDPRPPEALPEFCDYSCRHAEFAPPEVSGACRREQAVYCLLAGEWNGKHARCLVRAKRATAR